MPHNRSAPSVPVIPVLTYPDVRAAVAWLTDVCGFRERVRIGEAHRSQMETPAGGAVIVADVHGDRRAPIAGHKCHSVMVRVPDVAAHCEHARAQGAEIIVEPREYQFGERQYEVEDLAGHRWTFTQTVADRAPAEWGGEGGWPEVRS